MIALRPPASAYCFLSKGHPQFCHVLPNQSISHRRSSRPSFGWGVSSANPFGRYALDEWFDSMGMASLVDLLRSRGFGFGWVARSCQAIRASPQRDLATSVFCRDWVSAIATSIPCRTNAWQPASVRIQQWFHGEPVSIQSWLLSPELQQSARQLAETSEASVVGGDKRPLPAKLAISADPLHTRTAIGTLCLAAVVAWLSSLVWSQRARDQVLLIVVCGLGCIMACIFFFEATAITVPDWLMHDRHIMTGTFHSKNVAAAYLLAGLSAGIGLLVSRFHGSHHHRKKRDFPRGYRIPRSSEKSNALVKPCGRPMSSCSVQRS